MEEKKSALYTNKTEAVIETIGHKLIINTKVFIFFFKFQLSYLKL